MRSGRLRRAVFWAAAAALLAPCAGRAFGAEPPDVGAALRSVVRSDYTDDEITLLREQLRYRVDAGFNYDYLNPHPGFGDWWGGEAGIRAQVHPAVTVFGRLGGALRPGGADQPRIDDVLGSAGVIAELHRDMSSTTTLLWGSNSVYLPTFEANQEFEIGFPVSDDVVIAFTPGLFYSKDIYRQSVVGFLIGPLVHFYAFAVGYSFLYGQVEPGNMKSMTHTFTGSYDREGWFESSIAVEFGNGNYLTTYAPVVVKENTQFVGVQLSHRHWIGVDGGLYGQLRFTKIYTEYEAWGGTIGGFYEF
jgi:YaiO family outer membrane protein